MNTDQNYINRELTGISKEFPPNNLIDEHFICSLLNIDSIDIQNIHCTRDIKDGNTSIYLTLIPSFPECPDCGSFSPKIKDYYTRKINHSVLSNTNTILFYKDRRYICSHCRKTYYAMNPFTTKAFQHSTLTSIRVLEDLKDPNSTMASISRRYHLSPTTIANIFDAHVDIGRRKLPRFISIDEVYAFKSNTSKYVCVLLDYKNKIPIDILPARTYDQLMRFFSAIPLEERNQVDVFSCDMWETYRSIAQRYLPNAKIVVDHFHIIQECNKRLDRIRLNIQKNFPRKSDTYYLLKKFNWVLYKNDEILLDSNRKKHYNRKLKRYLNYHDIKCLLQESHPELEVAINLKDALCMYYDSIKLLEETIDSAKQETVPELKYKADGSATKRSSKLHHEAKKRNQKRILSEADALIELDTLITRFRECTLIEFSSFASTLNKWKHEIVNSLRIYEDLNLKAMSNALIENRNKIIKNVKRTANGYSNWRRFRNRLLYMLNPNNTYSLTPDQSMIDWKKKKNHERYIAWKKSTSKS